MWVSLTVVCKLSLAKNSEMKNQKLFGVGLFSVLSLSFMFLRLFQFRLQARERCGSLSLNFLFCKFGTKIPENSEMQKFSTQPASNHPKIPEMRKQP